MKTRLLLPSFLLLAATVLPAQKRMATCVLLVHFGAGDIVLNDPLIDALLDEPELVASLRTALGSSFSHATVKTANQLPTPHLPGTFQIHLRADLHHGEWNDTTRDAAIDAIVAHLQQRLSTLLFEQPRQQLQARSAELQQRCADLAEQRSAHELQREAAAARHDAALRQHEQLEQQLLAARIDAETEERALARLEELVAVHQQQRDEAEAERDRRAAEENALRVELTSLDEALAQLRAQRQQRPDDPELAAQQAALTGKIRSLQDRLAGHRGRPQGQPRSEDAERLLAATLEQLPLSRLALQRAQARLASIEEQLARVREELSAARKELAEARAPSAERIGIDLTVCRSLLTEVQGKLGRLEPVRIEVVRRRSE